MSNDRDNWLKLSNENLLRQCEISYVIGSGTGGQKRNKTSNAVRIKHLPSGITVTDCETRSQSHNRNRAIEKLRLQLAFKFRSTPDRCFLWRKIAVSHPDYPLFIAKLLDVLYASGFKTSTTAETLQISTGMLIKTLGRDPALWQLVNRCREQLELGTLKKR